MDSSDKEMNMLVEMTMDAVPEGPDRVLNFQSYFDSKMSGSNTYDTKTPRPFKSSKNFSLLGLDFIEVTETSEIFMFDKFNFKEDSSSCWFRRRN